MQFITKGAIITAAVIALILAVGYGIGEQKVDANWPSITVGNTTSTHASVSKQIASDLVIKRNLILTVRALTTNTSVVRLASTEAGAHSTSSVTDFLLYPGESIGLFVENANDVWFTAVAGEGVSYITEWE